MNTFPQFQTPSMPKLRYFNWRGIDGTSWVACSNGSPTSRFHEGQMYQKTRLNSLHECYDSQYLLPLVEERSKRVVLTAKQAQRRVVQCKVRADHVILFHYHQYITKVHLH